MTNAQIQNIINTHNFRIVSGEGEQGTVGPLLINIRKASSLKKKLSKEKCGGQRWARVEYQHNGEWIKLL
jgi:hypothetical protein